MHPSVHDWIAAQVHSRNLAPLSVLEVGSRNVNGSVRDLFTGPYLGVDVVDGPGVDLRHDIVDGPVGTFDVVVSTEMLEHCWEPWRAIAIMVESLKANGHFLLTCRGYDQRGCWPVHDSPDLWRFSAEALGYLLEKAGLRILDEQADPDGPGWMFCAVR